MFIHSQWLTKDESKVADPDLVFELRLDPHPVFRILSVLV